MRESKRDGWPLETGSLQAGQASNSLNPLSIGLFKRAKHVREFKLLALNHFYSRLIHKMIFFLKGFDFF
jgi:hypothetical protein